MIEIEAKLRRWGRSFGIIIPVEAVRDAQLKEDEKLEVRIRKRKNILKEVFGSVKTKRTAEELLKESDKEAWGE